MTIEVKNSEKPVNYIESIKILEKRANDVYLGKKSELLWILEHNTVYTAGVSAKDDELINELLKHLEENKMDFTKCKTVKKFIKI